MITDDDAATAPCLKGTAISESASRLVRASRRLPASPASCGLRAFTVAHLFNAFERIAASGEEPTGAFARTLDETAAVMDAWTAAGMGDWNPEKHFSRSEAEPASGEPVVRETGQHYGRLFEAFSDQSYWDEPKALLAERLERNQIASDRWRSRTVLDAGCGGGRYTAAWRLLGAGRCVGVDMSAIGVGNAQERARAAGLDQVVFQQGDVLALPFDDNSFDVVYSNGVLHHTTDWRTGVQELARVLRPGGLGWLYLIESPGGLFWDMIEILRVLTRGGRREIYRDALRAASHPANRIFYMLDHVMVPINLRLASEEIEAALSAAGAKDIRRLSRGTDFDRVEQIHRGAPHAAALYGVGENRHVFTK